MTGVSDAEQEEVLSQEDKAGLFDLIGACVSCSDEAGLKEIVEDLKDWFDYEFALCSCGKPGSLPTTHTFINVSYPEAWVELYHSKQLYTTDPIIKEYRLSAGLQYWADTFAKHGYDSTVHSTASRFGIESGYTCGVKSYTGVSSLFSFGGKVMDRDPRTEAIIESITPHLHQALVKIAADKETAQVSERLSKREIEVLSWAREGKTIWETSCILSIGSETVRWHMKNILKKLGASNKSHAVAIALEQGILHAD